MGRRWAVVATTILGTACSDLVDPPAILNVDPQAALGAVASARSIGIAQGTRWSEQPDSAIWNAAAGRDSIVIVGIKTPGSSIGYTAGRSLVSDYDFAAAIAATRSIRDAVARADRARPRAWVRVASVADIAQLRALPYTDYVEPSQKSVYFLDVSCTTNAYNGATPTVPIAGVGYGFDFISLEMLAMNVSDAWEYSTGLGQTIGISDTGVDNVTAGAEFSSPHYSAGLSSGRGPFMNRSPGFTGDGCGHGSKVASLAAAPRNGRSVVGVAYRSTVESYYIGNDVVASESAAMLAINWLANHGARVISVAWAMYPASDDVADAIRTLASPQGPDVLFVAAAGTTGAAGSHPPGVPTNSLHFPASMPEVFAVSAADLSNPLVKPADVHTGSGLDVIAYTRGFTAGRDEFSGNDQAKLTKLGGSSGAVGIMTGVAALVRARYPDWKNDAIRNRIVSTAGNACRWHPSWHVMVNADAAVGGVCLPAGAIVGPPTILFDRHAYGDTRTQASVEYCANPIAPALVTFAWNAAAAGSAPSPSGSHCRVFTFARGSYTATINVGITDAAVTGATPRYFFKAITIVDADANPNCPTCF